jgi:hypothetical protein
MRILKSNPFTDEYWHEELAFYGRPTVKPPAPLTLDWPKIQGRCDDYLNVNMRFDETPFPRLCEKGRLWMSLTPMEVQSAALALLLAHGNVVVGGLGLGYYALRAAAKRDVKKVTVYEINPVLIAWFKKAFARRKELAKIEIIEGDLREICQGVKADLAFIDIYPALLGDEVITDSRLLRRKNQFTQYVYWGWERAWFDAMRHGIIKRTLFLPSYLLSFFQAWQATTQLQANFKLEKDFVKKAYAAVDLLYA